MNVYSEDAHEREIRHKAEVAALHEEIDRLLAALKIEQEKTRRFDELHEKLSRVTLALDEALAIIRARNALRYMEQTAGL